MTLCRDIETDLRLHVHSAHLKGTVNVNPTKVLSRLHDLRTLHVSLYVHVLVSRFSTIYLEDL